MMHVKIDSQVIWESKLSHALLRALPSKAPQSRWVAGTHPEDGLLPYSAIFTARHETATLRFENDSPEGDRSVFIDSVSVTATANGLSVVLPSSSAEMQPYDFQLLSTPMTWDAAEAECERRNRKLASVHSIAENDYIAQLHRTDDGPSASSYSAGMCESSNGRPQPSRHAVA